MSTESPIIALHEGCPSELELDLLSLAELPRAETELVQSHIAGCLRCQQRAAFREAGLTPFRDFDAEAVLARVERAVIDARTSSSAGARRRSRAVAIAASLAAAVLGLAVLLFGARGVLRPAREAPAEERVRLKGDLSLRVFRKRGGDVEEVLSGERFRARDLVQFMVATPEPSEGAPPELMILSVAKSGARSIYYPGDGSSRSRPPIFTDEGVLLKAIELDASPEEERLHLIACPRPFTADEVEAEPGSSDLRLPGDCRGAVFLLRKDAP